MKPPADAHLSPRALFEDYLSGHVTACPEPAPCRVEGLLGRARGLLLDPGTEESSALPLLLCRRVLGQAVPAHPSHLSGLVRATEALETLCLNLYGQPWRKDIRSIKTFTGAFVYCLLPALSSATLRSVLAAIGYLPQDGPSPSEYRLSEEASPEQALRVAFQMFQVRALCLHLLQLLQQDPPTAQEWLDRLRSRVMPEEVPQSTDPDPDLDPDREERRTEIHDTQEVEEREVQHREEEHNEEEEPAQRAPGLTEDQSIVQMQMKYPDLVFRGRPLLQDKAHGGASSSQPNIPQRRPAQRVRSSLHLTQTNKEQTDESPSGPQGLSLHITLRPQNNRPPAPRGSIQQHPTDLREDTEPAVKGEAEGGPAGTDESELQPTPEKNQLASEENQLASEENQFASEENQFASEENQSEEQEPEKPSGPGACEQCTQVPPPSAGDPPPDPHPQSEQEDSL